MRRAFCLLASCYRNSLQLAVGYEIRSIAFLSISTDVYCFPVEIAAEIAVGVAYEFMKEHTGEMDMILWCLFDERTEKIYQDSIRRLRQVI